MKLKITRPDGTIIEAEGTVEECERLLGAPIPVPYTLTLLKTVPVPVYPVYPVTYPVYPTGPTYPINPEPWITWTTSTGTSSCDIVLNPTFDS